MPELPEVETVRRALAPVMEGQRIARLEARRADLRFPLPDRFDERLNGARVERLARRAKYLIADLSTGESLLMHLGMSGRFTINMPSAMLANAGRFVHDPGGIAAHDHVIFHMVDGVRVVFNDPRRFGFMELVDTDSLPINMRLKWLGPEPLSNGFSPDWLDRKLARKATPIKAALLDQSVVAGLGNIYVCEALHRAGISPFRSAHTIPGDRSARLVPAINETIAEAIEAGGSTLRDFAHPDGSLGYFPMKFRVYGREGQECPTCGGTVVREAQSARSSFYCPGCQG